MRPPRLHARTRLTLWYSGLLVGTLLLLGAGTMFLVERLLSASLTESLQARARAVEAAVEHELGENDGAGTAREIEAQAAGLEILRVWDQRGRAIFRRETGARQSGPDPPFAGIADEDRITMETLTDGNTVRVVTHTLRSRSRPAGVVQVGESTALIERALTQLRLMGLAGLALALVLAVLGGAFLARRALAPIDRITRAAQEIGAENLARRLDLDLPDDEIGRLAGAFDQMIARLDAAFERQRRFTADASHEIRTPLGIIRSQVDVALAHPRTPEHYVRTLTGVRSETDRLTQLTERLLTLARADANESLTLLPVDLQEIAAEAGVRVATRARDLGIHLDVQIGEAPEVRGDPIWLSQVLMNLLDNALRHTARGGRIALSLAGQHDGATIAVGDTGEGIAPEHLPHLFDRFYRVDAARSRAAGGSGLGLAICRWVADAHGGHLTVTSGVGQGTTITLWLPARSEQDHPPAPQAPDAPARRDEAVSAPS
jgi:heavy metal sensor kinase